MKNIKYIIVTALLLLSVTGCEVLDKEPLDVVSDAIVWNDATLVDIYLANVYFDSDMAEQRDDRYSVSNAMIASMAGEGRSYGGHHQPYRAATRAITTSDLNWMLDYWPYINIRNANFFIEQLTNESTIDQAFRDQRIAEARFLRAYMYFQMVIRFGGVPLITEVQGIDATEAELFPARASEKDVYDWIISEADALAVILPDAYPASDKGRPTSWAALALKSRAAIFAASIAKYGTPQLSGLLGFPASDATAYAAKALAASNDIINNSSHALYEVLADKAENYHMMMIDESDANMEPILVQVYDYGKNKGHCISNRCMPHEFSGSWGSVHGLYDWIERYEFMDGSPGTSMTRAQIDWNDNGNVEWTMDELFGNKDPRMHGSFFIPDSPWKGGTVSLHSGTWVDGVLQTSGMTPDGLRVIRAHERNQAKSGFMVKKRTNETVEPSGGFPGLANDETDVIIFRLGEVYLNRAEANFYLDNDAEALADLNIIRARAGMPAKLAIDEATIQSERLIELTWENQSWWDMRRWRIAEAELDGKRMAGVKWYYNYNTAKYRVDFINGEGVARIFLSHYYYLPMTLDRTSENPNIVQNPGY